VRPVELRMPPRRSNRVNNEVDPAFTTAVAHAVADLLPTLTARITDEIRQNENNRNNVNQRNGRRGPGNDGDAQPTDIHVWLKRFRKEKPQTFSSASTPVEAENWISHIEKIFEVLGCDDQFKARLAYNLLEGDRPIEFWIEVQYFSYSEKERCEREYKSICQLPEETSTDFMKRFLRLAGFLGAKAGTQEEQVKHFKWGLNDFVLDRILNTEFTDVAQGSNPRADDRRDSDRYGNRGRHETGLIIWPLTDGVVIDTAMTDMVMVVTDMEMVVRRCGVTKISRKAYHRATGACFECGEVGHLAKDCKKGSTSSGENDLGSYGCILGYGDSISFTYAY
ncbi:zinc finger, CCHC-type, retrotransposon gag domain protein, partial [Tanacetum coccineum]